MSTSMPTAPSGWGMYGRDSFNPPEVIPPSLLIRPSALPTMIMSTALQLRRAACIYVPAARNPPTRVPFSPGRFPSMKKGSGRKSPGPKAFPIIRMSSTWPSTPRTVSTSLPHRGAMVCSTSTTKSSTPFSTRPIARGLLSPSPAARSLICGSQALPTTNRVTSGLPIRWSTAALLFVTMTALGAISTSVPSFKAWPSTKRKLTNWCGTVSLTINGLLAKRTASMYTTA